MDKHKDISFIIYKTKRFGPKKSQTCCQCRSLTPFTTPYTSLNGPMCPRLPYMRSMCLPVNVLDGVRNPHYEQPVWSLLICLGGAGLPFTVTQPTKMRPRLLFQFCSAAFQLSVQCNPTQWGWPRGGKGLHLSFRLSACLLAQFDGSIPVGSIRWLNLLAHFVDSMGLAQACKH